MSDAARAQQVASAAGLSETANVEMVTVSYTDLEAAFELWLTGWAADPERYKDLADFTPGEGSYGQECRVHLLALLDEVMRSA